MRGVDRNQQSLFSYISIEDRIAADHPLRRMKRLTDTVLSSMSPQFDELYAEGGAHRFRPSGCCVRCCCNVFFRSVRSGR
jgi:hypothetical protein